MRAYCLPVRGSGRNFVSVSEQEISDPTSTSWGSSKPFPFGFDGHRNRRWCGEAAPEGLSSLSHSSALFSYMQLPAGNPSVSLTADSSPSQGSLGCGRSQPSPLTQGSLGCGARSRHSLHRGAKVRRCRCRTTARFMARGALPSSFFIRGGDSAAQRAAFFS